MQRISVHKITDLTSLPFSDRVYSLFKFGSKNAANAFGKQLFHRFREYLFLMYGGILGDIPQIVVCSAPYNHIPTATGAMKDYFVKYLNEYLVAEGAPVVQESKVHRDTTYREDYGSLSKEQRMELIGRDTFHIDTSFIEGKLVIFIDDIRITGSHEEMMKRMLIHCAHSIHFEYMFLYFAELTNPTIHPNVENDLNFASIGHITDIWDLTREDDFMFNTRVVKYILNTNPEEGKQFLENSRLNFLDTLYHLAIGNSYHLIPEYQENLTFLKCILDDNREPS